ncbi:MAG TPA: flavodoxin [Acidimicrobiales bacterium]|nr:flavodoxin [Acidimicrobiales bacterium]
MARSGDGTGEAGGAGRRLLVVWHSRTGSTAALRDAALAGAAAGGGEEVTVRAAGAFDAGPEDVLWAQALLVCTPANFGYMAGALKDFLERVYHPCLDRTHGLPYALVVKGDTDVDGAVASVERIVAGLRWRRVLPPVTVVGPVTAEALAQATELGATLAAGLEAGIF